MSPGLDAGESSGQERELRSPPKFSVITITRNDKPGLVRTIASLRNQTVTEFEHIIIDGASTDGTPALLASYSADYPIQIVSEPDRGIYDAMNKGVRLATGDLVVFMNSGDIFGSNETLAFVRDQYVVGGWRWGFGCMRYVDPTGKHLSGQIQAPFDRNRLFMGVKFIPHQAMYIELEFLRGLGPFRLDVGIAADQELAIRAAIREEPAVWIEFLTDFLIGGAHASIGRWQREYIYHRIRRDQAVMVANSRVADYGVAAAIALWRSARDTSGQLLRSIRAKSK